MHLITREEAHAVVAGYPSTDGFDRSMLDEPNSGSSLLTFLVLTSFSEMFLQRGWSAESVFWSRYYWFRRFIFQRAEIAERDAGLEQQAFKILEQPFPPCVPAWFELEAVEQRARAK